MGLQIMDAMAPLSMKVSKKVKEESSGLPRDPKGPCRGPKKLSRGLNVYWGAKEARGPLRAKKGSYRFKEPTKGP